jgi:hypothetical protein
VEPFDDGILALGVGGSAQVPIELAEDEVYGCVVRTRFARRLKNVQSLLWLPLLPQELRHSKARFNEGGAQLERLTEGGCRLLRFIVFAVNLADFELSLSATRIYLQFFVQVFQSLFPRVRVR